jgi:bleomycin hydrolase
MEKVKADQKQKDEVTQKIRERQKKEKEERRVITSDMTGVYPPDSPQDFKQYFHFPPVAQYMTSTCWSFSATSYFESEIFRLTGKKIKLSEMWAPYYELIEKCRRFIQERGESYVAGGAQSNSVTRMWKKHGIVPAEVFPGVAHKGDKHNHGPMMKELKSYLEYIKENNLWDEEDNLKHITLILNKHMGEPPKTFTYNGKTMTPMEFLKNETGLNLDDYYSTMSTSYFPFYTQQEYKVPDNWWHSKVYINLPLDVWYGIIKKSIQKGYTMIIGGDISEAGKVGAKDVAFIPTFDIPEKYIDQDSREYRIYNETTQDDHGIHLVGYKHYKGKDWFLIKDSGRSARKGKHHGYYFFRSDFIKLKMLTSTIHKDMLKDILPKLKK